MSKTLTQLTTLARQLSDTELDTGFIADAEVYTYVNHGARALQDILVDVGKEAWMRALASTNTVAGTATVSYPSGSRKIAGISTLIGDNNVPITPIDFGRRDRFDDVNGWDDIAPVYYSLESGAIRFFPTPDAVYPLSIWHLKDFAELTAGTDTLEAFGYEHYASYHAAIQMLNKEKSDPSLVMAERERIEQQIREIFADRDKAYPERIRDVRSALNDTYWRWR